MSRAGTNSYRAQRVPLSPRPPLGGVAPPVSNQARLYTGMAISSRGLPLGGPLAELLRILDYADCTGGSGASDTPITDTTTAL